MKENFFLSLLSSQLNDFTKFAQYIASINLSQNCWSEVGKIIHTAFSTDIIAHSKYDENQEIKVLGLQKQGNIIGLDDILFDKLCTKDFFQSEEIKIIEDVLTSGVMATHKKDNWQLLFLPIEQKSKTTDILIIGYNNINEFPQEILNLYLAVSDLVGACISKNTIQQEFQEQQENIIKTLDKKVNEKTKDLETVNISLTAEIKKRILIEKDKENLHKELCETTKVAGMATMATDVLHNIGNAICSVKTAISVLSENLIKNSPEDISLIYNMLEKNKDSLGDFFINDKKGSQIMPYLKSLGEHFKKQNQKNIDEVSSMEQGVLHIIDVISGQQKHAQNSVSKHKVDTNIRDMVEEAVEIVDRSCNRHGIDIRTVYVNNSSFSLERHKVVQVLINLLSNAKHAIQERKTKEDMKGCIEIKGDISDKNLIMSVKDNGIGIPKNNINQIFNFGFTTKSTGKGFGLHGSGNLISEMGGNIKAENNKFEKGVTFRVKIPVEMVII